MPKFYVESGRFQSVIAAETAHAAAVKAVRSWSDRQPYVVSLQMGLEVEVSEQGFGRRDGECFESFGLLAAAQGMTAREYFVSLAFSSSKAAA